MFKYSQVTPRLTEGRQKVNVSFRHYTKLILTTGKPLWQDKALYGKARPQPPVDTREYILEKNIIHVMNVVRFVPKELIL